MRGVVRLGRALRRRTPFQRAYGTLRTGLPTAHAVVIHHALRHWRAPSDCLRADQVFFDFVWQSWDVYHIFCKYPGHVLVLSYYQRWPPGGFVGIAKILQFENAVDA